MEMTKKIVRMILKMENIIWKMMTLMMNMIKITKRGYG